MGKETKVLNFMQKLFENLLECKTISDIEALYRANKKDIEAWGIKSEVVNMFANQKRLMEIECLARITGFRMDDIDAYILTCSEDLKVLIGQALEKNPEAVKDLKARLEKFTKEPENGKDKEKEPEAEIVEEDDQADAESGEGEELFDQ
jgi:hypothetical protein